MLIAVPGACKSGLTVVAALGLLGTAGCGEDGPVTAPPEISGPAQRAARTVDRLDAAVRMRDYDTICAELLTRAARRRAGGERCAATIGQGIGKSRRTRIRVLSIALDGRRAEARVRTRAGDQAPRDESLLLERVGRGYRIAALAR